MKVRIYTKQDKVKLIEADIPILEYLLIRDALTDFYKNEKNDETERAIVLSMLVDMDPKDAEIIDIGDMS